MKILAVRLKEVGHFTSGVALEGLSGRFDVLAGPNEMGKSTIFRAIEAAFGVKYDSERAKALAPLSGGAPLVEIDFTAGGTAWRLRKRYLAQKSAELTDLNSSVLLRGGDAEERLRDLVAGPNQRSGMRHLLWVGQRQSHLLPDQTDMTQAVGRLIEAEIADAASQGVARRLREDVAGALAQLVTSRGPKAHSPYKAAVDARDKANAELDKASAAATEAEARVRRLDELRSRWKQLNAPQILEHQVKELVDLHRRREEAAEARRKFDLADLVVATRQNDFAQAEAKLLALTGAIQDEQRLRVQLEAAGAALASTDAELGKAAANLAKLQQERHTCRQALAGLQTQLADWDLHLRQDRARAALADLDLRRNAAEEITKRIQEIEASLVQHRVDDVVLSRLRRAADAITKLEAKVDAALPKVSIDYFAGAQGRIEVGGRAIAASGEIAPATTIDLTIEGIGRITIRAAVASGEDPLADLTKARGMFDQLCADAGVVGMDAAELQRAERQKLINEYESLAARLREIAPSGPQQLVQQSAAAIRDIEQLGADVQAPPMPRSAIAASCAALSAQYDHLEAAERVAQSDVLSASERASQIRAARSSNEARLDELIATLPPVDEREAAVASARSEFGLREDALNSAVRERSAWQAAVLQPAQQAELRSQIDAAEKARAHLLGERRQLELDINGLESALERDRQDGIGSVLEDARANFDATQTRVMAFEREVEELRLLEHLLNGVAEKARTEQLLPVVSRMAMLADDFMPGVQFSLGDNLRVDGIERSGRKVTTGQLSGGTSEQIHVLVRLAYARLAADQGSPMPLILDDALVYADDQRYGSMLAAIAKASEHHQVIMLTCHAERTLRQISASAMNIVELKQWTAV